MRASRQSELLRWTVFALSGAATFSACGGDDDERPSSFPMSTGGRLEVPMTGGRPETGGVTDPGGGSGGTGGSAGSVTESGGAGGAPDVIGNAGTLADGGEKQLEPFETPPLCPGPDAWSEGERLELSSEHDDRLFAVTPDELTLVFRAGDRLYYADRPSTDEAFAEPAELEDTGFVELAISPDGLRLVGTREGNQSFAEVSREARDEAFGTEPDDSAFAELNYAVSAIPVSRRVGDPVLAGEGDRLLFSYYEPMPEGSFTIRETSGPPWSFGVPLGGEMLMAMGGKRRIATGLGADLRTLFYWDEVDEVQRAAERAEDGGTFDRFHSFGEWRGATPNTACDRLYYSAPGPDGDLDLFVSSVE